MAAPGVNGRFQTRPNFHHAPNATPNNAPGFQDPFVNHQNESIVHAPELFAPEFAIFRRFGLPRTRVLLYKQDELVELETRLLKLDNEEQIPYHLCPRRSNPSAVQKALVAEIETKLREYDGLLDAYHRTRERPTPHEENIKSVVNWLDGNKPLSLSESTFMNDWEDLVATRYPAEFGRIEEIVTKSRIVEFFGSSYRGNTSVDKNVLLGSFRAVTVVSRVLTTAFPVVLLLTPIIVLNGMGSTNWKLGVIIFFSVCFSSVLSSFTAAPGHEIFATTATYCAVMVVFVGINGNQSQGSAA
ncbi:hypothetical protein HYALB_00011136 [Hymenoscyphus albidus]|uniref:DUF6594 domain-containing protein n=1 Tax=Hymenoscyphus albidus TaxID=595503 RepID=A0A9N9LIP7_9HELO|nr:hypothetical protein HYALB_00011136 [Hymenoscyphus albidus]